jgi:CheY-like chemotaxis protein
MKKTLFLFQWDKTSAQARAKLLRAEGWTVSVESEDGARLPAVIAPTRQAGGSKNVLQKPPDVIAMDLAKRPSHSRETEKGIRGYKAGRTIPMVFVDGTKEDIAKTKAKVSPSMFTTLEKLVSGLEKIGEDE